MPVNKAGGWGRAQDGCAWAWPFYTEGKPSSHTPPGVPVLPRWPALVLATLSCGRTGKGVGADAAEDGAGCTRPPATAVSTLASRQGSTECPEPSVASFRDPYVHIRFFLASRHRHLLRLLPVTSAKFKAPRGTKGDGSGLAGWSRGGRDPITSAVVTSS